MKRHNTLAAAAIVASVACVVGMTAIGPTPALGQSNPTMTNVIPEGGSAAVSGKVRAVDQGTRTITIAPSSGQPLPLVAPANVDIGDVDVGDMVSAHYTRSVAFLIAPPGEERPGNTTTTVDRTAHAPSGIGPQATEIRGAVTKINSARSFDIVDATGGGVFTIQVSNPARVALVHQLKTGDRITVSVGPLVMTSLAKCGPFGLICG